MYNEYGFFFSVIIQAEDSDIAIAMAERLMIKMKQQRGAFTDIVNVTIETTPCPQCKSKATKLYNLSTSKLKCQICGYEWSKNES